MACFCTALLHASKHGRADVFVALHDYKARPHYHIVESIAKLIDSSTSSNLVVFRRLPNVSDEAISDLWGQYRNDYE